MAQALLGRRHGEREHLLAAIGVGADGGQEVLAVAEVMKEDAESWHSFVFVQ